MAPAKNATQPDTLTPEQAAERLRVSRAKILDWLRSGRLRGSKLGYRTWRITPSEIAAFLERETVKAQ